MIVDTYPPQQNTNKKARPSDDKSKFIYNEYDKIDDDNMTPPKISASVFQNGPLMKVEFPLLQKPENYENLSEKDPLKKAYIKVQNDARNVAARILLKQSIEHLKAFNIDACGMGRTDYMKKWAASILYDPQIDKQSKIYGLAEVMHAKEGLKQLQMPNNSDVQLFCSRCMKISLPKDKNDIPCFCMVARGHWYVDTERNWDTEEIFDDNGKVVRNMFPQGKAHMIYELFPPSISEPPTARSGECLHFEASKSKSGNRLGRPKGSGAGSSNNNSSKSTATINNNDAVGGAAAEKMSFAIVGYGELSLKWTDLYFHDKDCTTLNYNHTRDDLVNREISPSVKSVFAAGITLEQYDADKIGTGKTYEGIVSKLDSYSDPWLERPPGKSIDNGMGEKWKNDDRFYSYIPSNPDFPQDAEIKGDEDHAYVNELSPVAHLHHQRRFAYMFIHK